MASAPLLDLADRVPPREPDTRARRSAMSSQEVLSTPPPTTPDTKPERRRPPEQRRVPYRVPCRIRLINKQTGEVRTVVGETINISTGDTALQLGTSVPIGTWVETLVPRPNGEPLFLCGTVVHRRRVMASGFEIGIRTHHPTAFV
jgi:hypothetical protein